MQPDHVLTIAKREFLVRIRSKGFWIATIVLPLFMSAMLFIPAFLAAHAKSSQRLVVVDVTGRVAAPLAAELGRQVEKGEGLTRFEVELEPPAAGSEAAAEAQRQELDRRVLDDDIDAWVWIDDEGLADDEVEYHAESVSNLMTQESLAHALSSVVRELRLSEAGYDSALIEELSRSVDLSTVRISAEGSRA
jgi:ABC-type Na+ efflux pump permease subunit